MAQRDMRLELDPQPTLRPQSATGAVTGLDVDMFGAESALFVVSNGAATTAATIQVQESDTGGGAGYTAVADTDLIGLTGNPVGVLQTAASVVKVSYIGTKRFVRLNVLAGASAALVSADVVRGHLRHAGGVPV
jgi:hypothetical protein